MRSSPSSRRDFMKRSVFTAAALASRCSFAQDASSRIVVKTREGSLVGQEVNGVRIFRGVPFAQPPVGTLRFQPPMRLKPWTGTRDALQFSAAAMQPDEPKLKQSEDCLYVNVWAPADIGPHPVFVWIHGGGFTGGHAFAPIFDGSEFANQGIVVVTVAYRLGIFGFLDLEPLLGARYAGSGNNGLRDLIAALQWVQENIAVFGGDPARVTVGGESAGAKLTDILMGTPEAAALFQQMISESGGAERVWPKMVAASIATGFGDLWTKQRSETTAGLKVDPPESLVAVQEMFTATWPQHFPLRCEIDGRLLPRLPIESIAQGTTKGKRLLIGTNRDESALFIGPHPQKDPTAADLGNMTIQAFDDVFARYRNIYPRMSEEQRRIRALTAEEYWVPSIRVADAHVTAGGTAWMYRLDFAPSSGRFAGEAYHSSDLGLVWSKPNKDIANAEEEAHLAQQVHAAWVSFIRGDAPEAAGLPEWPKFSATERPTMIFDTQSRVEVRPQKSELALWNSRLM